MKRTIMGSLVVMILVAACSAPEESKTTSSSPASPSIGRQYGETLKGGIDKAKDIQDKMGERIQQIDEAAKQNQPSQDE